MTAIQRERGLSLVELMIALAIGSLLVLTVATTFLTANDTRRVERALGRVQHAGRVSIDLLSEGVRQAGYSGCNSIGGFADVAATGMSAVGVRAYSRTSSATTLSPLPTDANLVALGSVARTGSDVLVLDYGDFIGRDVLSATMETGDTSVRLASPPGNTPEADRKLCGLQSGQAVLFSNCVTSHVFRIADVSSTCANGIPPVEIDFAFGGAGADNNLDQLANSSYRYNTDSEMATFNQEIWFVADTGREQNGQTVYALYRLFGNQTVDARQEMVEGVEFLKIEVGEKMGTNLRFVPARSTDGVVWDNAVALRYSLLVQGFDAVSDSEDTRSYQLLSESIGPDTTPAHGGGRVIRRVFVSSQSLRNTNYGI